MTIGEFRLVVVLMVVGISSVVLEAAWFLVTKKNNKKNSWIIIIDAVVQIIGIVIAVISIFTYFQTPEITFEEDNGYLVAKLTNDLPYCKTYYKVDNGKEIEYTNDFSVNEGSMISAYSKLFDFFKSEVNAETAKWPTETDLRFYASLNDDKTAAVIDIRLSNDNLKDVGSLLGGGDARITMDWKKEKFSSEGLLSTHYTFWDQNGDALRDYNDMVTSSEYPTDISDAAAAFFLTGDTKDCVSIELKDLGVTLILTKEGLREGLLNNREIRLKIERTDELKGAFNVNVLSDSKYITDLPGGVVLRIENCDGLYAPIVLIDGISTASQYCQIGKTVIAAADINCNIIMIERNVNIEEETDIKDEAMRFARERGIYVGYDNGEYMPDGMMTVGELAQAFANMGDGPKPGRGTERWYDAAVRWAYENGIIDGGDLEKGGDSLVSLERCLVMLWRFAGSPEAEERELTFRDADAISEDAVGAVSWALELGVLEAEGESLNPGSAITRADAAVLIMNLYLKMADLIEAVW